MDRMGGVIGVQAADELPDKTLRAFLKTGMSLQGLFERAFAGTVRPGGSYLIIGVEPGQAVLEEALRTLAERLPELMQQNRKKLEERQIVALLDAFAPTQTDEASRALVMDNLVARETFLARFRCLSSKEVAVLAGHKAKNLSMTASRWRQTGKIFAVPVGGDDRYPAFQFKDGKPHRTVARVLAALPERKSPWQMAFWFVSNNGWLDGAAPMERLADGDAVVEAARREAEDVIG